MTQQQRNGISIAVLSRYLYKRDIWSIICFLHFSHEVFQLTSKSNGLPENIQTMEMSQSR